VDKEVIMKRIGIGLAGVTFGIVAALTLPSLGQSTGASSGASAHTVTVAGTATIKTAPDEAVVSLGVQTSAPTAEGALQQNAARMAHVLAVLAGSGISKSDIATTDVSLYPNYNSNGSGVSGYQASNNVEVTVHDMGRVGKVIDTAVNSGANLAGGIEFRVSDQNQGLNDALAAAVKDSRGKAEVLAGAGGAQLGSVVSIDETTAAQPPERFYAPTASAGGASTPINPPTLRTEISVTVVWALV
jgi:uncharacterized protein